MSEAYWRGNEALENITPKGWEWPEGEWFQFFMRGFGARSGFVVDYGCGPGRLAGFFHPERYLGLDINPSAIEAAQEAYPNRRFELTGEEPIAAVADVLLHTVALHVEDDRLEVFLRRILNEIPRARRIHLHEILGRKYRNPPLAFNRAGTEYEAVFRRVGWRLSRSQRLPYARYGDGVEISFLEFERC